MKHLFLLFVVYAEDHDTRIETTMYLLFLFSLLFSRTPPWPWLLDERGRGEEGNITIEQRTADLLRLFIRDFDEFRGKWLEVKSPWNLWAVHAHCDVITTSGVPFASKYSRLTRDCSMAGNKRTRKRACRCCNMERDFFLFVWFSLSFSLSHFVGIKEYYRKGWFKNAGITRVGGQTVFAHAKQRVNFWGIFEFVLRLCWYYIILYYIRMYMLFSDEGVEFLKRFFFLFITR